MASHDELLSSMDRDELVALKAEIEARLSNPEIEEEGIIALPVVDGCVDQEQLNFETHSRGKNWIATVNRDKKQPGGLARRFWGRASAGYKAVPADTEVGDIMEVAADYYTSTGRRRESREYHEVVSVDDKTLKLRPTKKP
jgi:hypothetical protein